MAVNKFMVLAHPDGTNIAPILVDDTIYNTPLIQTTYTTQPGSYEDIISEMASVLGMSALSFEGFIGGRGYRPSYDSDVINNDGTISGYKLHEYWYMNDPVANHEATMFYIDSTEPSRKDYPVPNPTQTTTNSSWSELHALPSGYTAYIKPNGGATYTDATHDYHSAYSGYVLCVGRDPNRYRISRAQFEHEKRDEEYDLSFHHGDFLVLPEDATDVFGDIISSNYDVHQVSCSIVRSSDKLVGYLTYTNWDGLASWLVDLHVVGGADPLSGGGYSGEGNNGVPGTSFDGIDYGGDGTFDLSDQDDDVPESALPPASSSIVGAGFGSVYCDAGTNVRSLAAYMWTHADDIIANLKKIMSNPIDSILALHIVPVVPDTGASTTVYLGNVSTSVSMTPVSNPYIRKRMGTLTVPKYWGSALDFNPFTQVQIYLPYIGYKPLNVDEIMGAVLELYYDIDVTTGACVAHLKITRTDPLTHETHVVDAYDFPGNCAMQIPVTATNYQGLYSAIVGAVTAIAGAVAAGSAGGAAGRAVSEASRGIMLAQSLSTAANAMYNGGSKIRVEKSGSLTGNHGFLSSQYAFLERTTPRQSLASTYRNVKGYPSNMSLTLAQCTGFTQVEDINLEGIDCTGDELAEIERLLKGGVLF